MDLLNRLSAKQLIFIVLIVGYLFYNLDSNSIVIDFFSSLKDRFNINKKLNKIEAELNEKKSTLTSEDSNDKANIKNINELRAKLYKSTSKNDEDEFCNKKKGKRATQFEEMFQCLLNNTPMTKDIMIPNNVIPYNFSDNKDNNVLYSINNSYTHNKLNYEKKLMGDVAASNNKLLHTNFDKDIDYYKINRKRDTIINLEKNQTFCNVDNLTKLPKELKIFTRVIDKNVNINWNIPILPFGFHPKEILFIISNKYDLTDRKNIAKSDFYTIPFSKKPCEFNNEKFSIKTNILGNRIIYLFSSELKNWYNKKRKCHKLSSKVYFIFNFYDKNKSIRECYMESNVSNLF